MSDEPFIDPQGTYTITIVGDWSELAGTFVKEVEAWAIAEPVGGFAPNVNVLTQDAHGADLSFHRSTVALLGNN